MSEQEKQHDEKRVKQFYTPKEVADMFGISVHALKNRRQRGQINPTFQEGKTVLYSPEDIAAADLSQRKRGPKPRSHTDAEQDAESEPHLAYACIA